MRDLRGYKIAVLDARIEQWSKVELRGSKKDSVQKYINTAWRVEFLRLKKEREHLTF